MVLTGLLGVATYDEWTPCHQNVEHLDYPSRLIQADLEWTLLGVNKVVNTNWQYPQSEFCLLSDDCAVYSKDTLNAAPRPLVGTTNYLIASQIYLLWILLQHCLLLHSRTD